MKTKVQSVHLILIAVIVLLLTILGFVSFRLGLLPIPTGTISPSWDDCVKTRGSRILQTYPPMCRYPDGRLVSQPIQNSPIQPETPSSNSPIPTQLPAPDTGSSFSWEECIKIPGSKILQTYPETCITPDGQKATKPIGQ